MWSNSKRYAVTKSRDRVPKANDIHTLKKVKEESTVCGWPPLCRADDVFGVSETFKHAVAPGRCVKRHNTDEQVEEGKAQRGAAASISSSCHERDFVGRASHNIPEYMNCPPVRKLGVTTRR